MPCATPPSTWPRTCAGLITHAGVGGLDAVEDADLAGHAVDGDAEAVGVGRDAARRAVRLARLGESDAARASRLEELGQRRAGCRRTTTPSSSIEHDVDSTPACAAANPRMRSRKAVGGPQNRVARHEQPRAGEGAGVESRAVGVGLHQADPRRCGAELVGRDLDMRGGGSLAEFDGADGDLVDAVVTERRPGLGDVLGRGRGLVHRTRGAGADEPVGAECADPLPSAPQRRVDEVDALAEAVLGERDVVGVVVDGQQGIAGADDVATPEFERIHVQLDRQLVHRRFHGERRLRHAVPAERAAGHGVGVDGVRVELLVRAAVDRDRRAPAANNVSPPWLP